jgi:hypothetical protein
LEIMRFPVRTVLAAILNDGHHIMRRGICNGWSG